MKKSVSILAALAITLGLSFSAAQAQTSGERVYLIDGRGEVAKNNFNQCWRTQYWTPAAAATDPAGCACDGDILPKATCGGVRTEDPKVIPTGGKITLPADALFDFNKSTLRAEGKRALDNVIAQSQSLNLEVMIVVGHADRIGGAAYNKKLSDRRAASVKAYAVSKGIPANRIYAEGKGSTQPSGQTASCGTGKGAAVIACLQPDRRVNIEMIGLKK